MPIPSRKKDEDREQFMSRCMSDENMKKDYKQNQQRIAVCLTKASEGMSSMAAADLHYNVEEFGYTEELSEENFYIPSEDFIGMPPKDDFKADKENTKEQYYYSTLLHELTHWSGHSSRCNRDLQNRFGSKAYAMEELVAEIGSAFLCSYLGVTKAPTPNHGRYLNNWLEVLKEDKKAIFKAFSLSKTSSEYLMELDQTETEEMEVA